MDLRVTYKDGVRFEAETRGHRIEIDQPISGGGQDRGMTPPELLLAALGSCAAYYAVEYLRARNLPAQGVEVIVHGEKAAGPARLGSFLIEVLVPELPEERHVEGVKAAVKKCLIHNTLLHAPSIEIAVNQGSPYREVAIRKGTRVFS